MFRILDKVDTGKTRKLLEECGKNNGVFVCKHPNHIEEKCVAYGLPLVRAIGYEDLIEVLYSDMFDEKYDIYIDELENFVSILLPNLKGWSMTNEED